MYNYSLKVNEDGTATVFVSNQSAIDVLEFRGVSLYEGIPNIELDTTIENVEGCVIESSNIPDGCTVLSVVPKEVGCELILSESPTKDVKSAKLIIKRVSDKQLFDIQVGLTTFKGTETCRVTLSNPLELDKTTTVKLTVRETK
jgi:hypothetical protein